MVLAFDDYFLDLERRELRRGAALIKLEPQVFDLLAYLVNHRDRLVTKDELVDAIWRGRIVSDSALTTRINAVRRAVGDNGTEQRLIRTLRRRGFRFVGAIREVATGQGTHPEALSGSLVLTFGEEASVGILPFTAITGDLEERWFAEGLVEDVVTAIGRFRSLSVLAPISGHDSSSREFDFTRLRCEGRVRYAVQGAVRRNGPQVRVTARLIDVATGRLLWADCFDGSLATGIEFQDKIASHMAGSIEPIVQSAEADRYKASSNPEMAPYALYLQAQPIFSSGKESVLRSLRLLKQAIELDPRYGSALADAANCRQVLDVNGWTMDRQLNRRKAIDLARKALQLSCDPEPVATSAFVLAYFGEDIDAAVALLDDSLKLNPSFAKGWYMSGFARLYAGQPEQAIECFERSMLLNPRDRVGRRNIGGIGIAHLFCRRFDEAISTLRSVLEEFPHWATPYCALASSHAHLGFAREADSIARRLRAADPCSVANAVQFCDARHRELLVPGLKLVGEGGSIV